MASSTDLESARAEVYEQVKINILTETQELDNEKQMQSVARSFISDTITVPTKEMYTYAALASMGDDVYHEPCTAALEAHIARITGKEAALFMPSGTMSNQIALRTHLKQPPYSVLCDHRSHINKYEAGGTSFHSGAPLIAVIPSNGHHLTLADVEANIVLDDNIHCAPTEVIELENTLNGTIFPQEDIVAISRFAREHGVKMHLDGARIWHVAAETGIELSTLLEPFDSASLCFSKGLGAPVGSCLVGPADFIKRARWFRKLFGGGMRQTGVLAASAAFALTHYFPRLVDVHRLAKRLQAGLEEIGAKITSPAETCMVFYDPAPLGVAFKEIDERARALPKPLELGGSRLVIHIQTSPAAVEDFLSVVRTLAEEKRAAGFIPPEKATVAPINGSIYRDIRVR